MINTECGERGSGDLQKCFSYETANITFCNSSAAHWVAGI